MRLLARFLVLGVWPLAACGTSTSDAPDTTVQVEDGGGDAAADAADIGADVSAAVLPPPKGYTAKFRATLANKAPAEWEEGERLFFEETFGSESLGSWPPAAWLVQLWQSDKAKWGEQFSNYGFLVDPGDDLPIGLKRGTVDASKVHENCSTCHVTQLADGRLWAGAPATKLAWSRFQIDLNTAWVAAGHPPFLSANAIANREAALQPGSTNISGDDDKLQVPNDFPAYFELGKMTHLNYLGTAADLHSEVWLSLYSLTEGLPFPSEALTTPFLAYFNWLPAPKPPTTGSDPAAITRGLGVYAAAKCNACHFVEELDKNSTANWLEGPEKMPGEDKDHPYGTIATDKNLFLSATGAMGGDGGPGPGLMDLILFIAENSLTVGPSTGYVALNLHGLWTTAPYLHNGSVPTLQDLLKPAKDRPKTFVREGFTVDTDKPGMSNVGHEFGTTLSAPDKADLTAYLLSL